MKILELKCENASHGNDDEMEIPFRQIPLIFFRQLVVGGGLNFPSIDRLVHVIDNSLQCRPVDRVFFEHLLEESGVTKEIEDVIYSLNTFVGQMSPNELLQKVPTIFDVLDEKIFVETKFNFEETDYRFNDCRKFCS